MLKLKKTMILLSLSVIMSFSVGITANTAKASTPPNPSVDYLETLSDEALLELFQPFQAIVDEINKTYGVDIRIISLCHPEGRPLIIEALAYISLEEHRECTREYAKLILAANDWNALQHAIWAAYGAEEIDFYAVQYLSENKDSIASDSQELSARREILDSGADISEALGSISPRLSSTTFLSRQERAGNYGLIVVLSTEVTIWTEGHTSGSFYSRIIGASLTNNPNGKRTA